MIEGDIEDNGVSIRWEFASGVAGQGCIDVANRLQVR
jgi:hypothetical protein